MEEKKLVSDLNMSSAGELIAKYSKSGIDAYVKCEDNKVYLILNKF